MNPICTSLTQKGQATIPVAIRKFLNLRSGDMVKFYVENNKVSLERMDPIDLAHLKALEGTLSEWNSVADNEAYNDL
jgi:antitoxin PrlF